jgi:CO dehydrogenase nickel-insertion accessory protein CooC1
MTVQKATNIKWHHGKITKDDRIKLLSQKGVTIWLTGLSGSGKSTIAVEIEHALIENKHQAYILDGDNIRHGLNKNLGFSPEDRTENIRIGESQAVYRCKYNYHNGVYISIQTGQGQCGKLKRWRICRSYINVLSMSVNNMTQKGFTKRHVRVRLGIYRHISAV